MTWCNPASTQIDERWMIKERLIPLIFLLLGKCTSSTCQHQSGVVEDHETSLKQDEISCASSSASKVAG